MRVPFRQGLVRVEPANFLTLSSQYVTLNVVDNPFVSVLASGSKDYLWVEPQTVANAWGPLTVGQDVWLFMDIDARSGARTFNHTTLVPVVSASAPSSPALNQHWYDTSSDQMKVWSGTAWQAKIRVFVAKASNGTVFQSMGLDSPAFTGTQVGDTTEIYAGQILFDLEDEPIKHTNGKFVTTEDTLRTRVLSTADVKLGSVQNEATAGENLAKYTIVVFSDFGIILHADKLSPNIMGQFGIVEKDVLTGELVNVVTSGVVTNADWDWTTIGINAPLYCDDTGLLVEDPVAPDQHPVAIVVGKHTIQLASPLIKVEQFDMDPASTTELGVVRLNLVPIDPVHPVVVGANDPRLTDARVPLGHSHPTSDITGLTTLLDGLVQGAGDTMSGELVLSSSTPTGNLVAASKGYVDNVAALKLDKSGGTVTGALVLQDTLTLDADPIEDLEAATKQYADTKVSKAGDTVTGPLVLLDTITLNADPITDLEAATKQYVDDSVAGISVPNIFQLSCSDLVTSLTVGTNKAYFRVPAVTQLSKIKITLLTASTSGNVQVSIHKNGVPVVDSPYTLFVSTKTISYDLLSSNTIFAENDEITIGIVSAGTGAKGLIVGFVGA